MTNIVVDKSFLQGTNGQRILRLASENRILMSDALFYELLTTKPEVRVQCFAKLPQQENPVDLVNHAGFLLRQEIDSGQPSGKPSLHKEDIRFVFNTALRQIDYVMPEDAIEAIKDETARLKDSVTNFMTKTNATASMFPNVLKGNQAERTKSHMEAEKTITAPLALRPFISQMSPPAGEKTLPPVDRMDESWAIYRWLQIQMLFALDIYVRYQGSIPDPMSQRVYEKLEHDVLDAEQLILGCLEGAYATKEKKHIRWWRLLCPSGTLYV
jgi:hypothetical protein